MNRLGRREHNQEDPKAQTVRLSQPFTWLIRQPVSNPAVQITPLLRARPYLLTSSTSDHLAEFLCGIKLDIPILNNNKDNFTMATEKADVTGVLDPDRLGAYLVLLPALKYSFQKM